MHPEAWKSMCVALALLHRPPLHFYIIFWASISHFLTRERLKRPQKGSNSQPIIVLLKLPSPFMPSNPPQLFLPPSSFFPFLPPPSLLAPVCVHSVEPLLQHGFAPLCSVPLLFFPCQMYLSCPSSPFLSPTTSCCYVLHMLWWLLLWEGEMIQAPGMHGRAAAGHCTCNSEKTSWGVHVQSMYVCVLHKHFSVCTRTFLIHQTPFLSLPLSLLAPLLCVSRHFNFPAFFGGGALSVPTLLLSHKQ